MYGTKVGKHTIRTLQFSPDGQTLAAVVSWKGVVLLHGQETAANDTGMRCSLQRRRMAAWPTPPLAHHHSLRPVLRRAEVGVSEPGGTKPTRDSRLSGVA